MELKQRLKKVIKHLIGIGAASTQKELGVLMGYKTESGFSQVINNKVALPDGFIDRLCSFDSKLSRDWIENGNGEMLLDKENLIEYKDYLKLDRVDGVTPVPFDNYMMVEYADLSTAAGPLGGTNVNDLPKTKTRLVPKEFDNGDYLVTTVDGDSMDDGSKFSIPNGTEILIKRIYLNPGETLPIRNNLFVVNAFSGAALKQITEFNIKEGYLRCHSYNPEFEDYIVYLDELIEVFIYKKIVSSRPPIPDIK